MRALEQECPVCLHPRNKYQYQTNRTLQLTMTTVMGKYIWLTRNLSCSLNRMKLIVYLPNKNNDLLKWPLEAKGLWCLRCTNVSVLTFCLHSFSITRWLQTEPFRCNGSCGWTCRDGMPTSKRPSRTHHFMEKRWVPPGWQRWTNNSKCENLTFENTFPFHSRYSSANNTNLPIISVLSCRPSAPLHSRSSATSLNVAEGASHSHIAGKSNFKFILSNCELCMSIC